MSAVTPPTPDTLLRSDLVHPDGRTFHVYGELHGTLAAQPSDTGYEVSALHQRFDLATGQWISYSPARNARPGGSVTPQAISCPLCPGGPELPFGFEGAAFDNRFPALDTHAPAVAGELVKASFGRCQVIVYTSQHQGSMATLSPHEVARVIALWRDRSSALWAAGAAYVMAFENRGAEVGATLAHPHGQLYAFDHLPSVIASKVAALSGHDGCVGCELVARDSSSERMIDDNDSFTVAVPFAARWPYEVAIRAKRHGAGRLSDLLPDEALDLAKAISAAVRRYDQLFGFELPYMMVIQEAPADQPNWHLHVEFYPPHRSENRLKVRASVETGLGSFINDTLPETTAARLRVLTFDPGDWNGVVVPTVVAAINANEEK
jgi:UDPglucose--hexose-1-phosphate uridylyltransferase